ncbi:hypothetical protein LUZ60_014485 [Juncus effusus]|nr:hypothetical protein LUZ60_014485 [Juncus effusus]
MARILALVAVAMVMMVGLLSNVEAGWSNHDASEFTITVTCLCQDCSKGYNQWAYAGTPVSGCKIDVTCMDSNGRPVYHSNDEADDQGKCTLTIPYSYNGFALKAEDCIARLVPDSGSSGCNLPTNFNGGKDGVCPVHPTNVYPDNIEYVLGPFFFTTPQCDVPQ